MYSDGEVVLNVNSEEIAATKRKLKAVWSYEANQDLRSFHNINAEKELTKILAEEISAEIDREILNDLRNACSGLPLPVAPVVPEVRPIIVPKKRPKYRDITSDWEVQMDGQKPSEAV